jgi:nickel/cobalt exporter
MSPVIRLQPNRFASRDITTGKIVMFGLTGGLLPCPASITVLLLCFQLKSSQPV